MKFLALKFTYLPNPNKNSKNPGFVMLTRIFQREKNIQLYVLSKELQATE